MFSKITIVKQLSLVTILALSINGCDSGSSTGLSTTNTSNQESITIVPADGYIYGASIRCSNGVTATLGEDNLSFTVNSLDPGTCEITGGGHIVNGQTVPNDTSLKVIVDSPKHGDKLFATPLTTLVTASVEDGEDRDSARKKVSSLMGLDPNNSSDVNTLLKADPTKLNTLSFSEENKNFDPATARTSIVSVYTMMEQFDNAGVTKDEMRTALKNIVDKGSSTQAREELSVSTMIEAIDSTLNTGKYKENFSKIEDLLGEQEQMLREIPDSDFDRLEDTIADTIKISQELEETITDTISQELKNETTSTQENDSVSEQVNPITQNSTNRTYAIVDTAQSDCYDSNSGSQKSCAKTGYDADYSGNQPSYTLSSSGKIVTDSVTSLMWTQSSDTDNDGETTDAGDKLSYDNSIAYCSNLTVDEYSDWRLPDIKTLYSLILFSGEDPSNYKGTDTSKLVTFLDSSFAKAFGDQDQGQRIIDGQYATTTKYVSTTMNGDDTMFGVNFVDGRIKGYPTSNRGDDTEYYVLCTRGNEDYGKNNFTDNGDATISDTATALMWEKNDIQSSDFEDAISTCESSATANHSDWRLPNAKELQSILDYTKSPNTTNSAAIDPLFNATSFNNEEGQTDWGYYWSSTSHVNSSGNGSGAAYLSFGRALGVMNNSVMDVHGAGAQRSNAKQSENAEGSSSAIDVSDGSTYYYKGPQGDILRTNNMVRCVRDDGTVSTTLPSNQAEENPSLSPGYVLFSTMGSDDTHLIDTDGVAVKTWTSSYASAGASYLTNTNTLIRAGLTNNTKTGTFSTGGAVGGVIEEFDSNGDVIWSYTADSDNSTLHHDFKEIDSNTIIALTWELKSYNNKEYWNEKIIKINKTTSSIVWEWSAMDNGAIFPSSTKADYLHFNSVNYKNGKILISSKEQNKLYEIDETTKNIVATYTAGDTLSSQHDASYLENGNILVFNNQSTQSTSSVLELNTNNTIIWEYSDDIYSDYIAGVQRLENGNTLICVGTEGKFLEVSPDKEILWEYTNNYTSNSPRGEMKSVFKIRKYTTFQ